MIVKNKRFYLDGEEFRIKSGAFHYFRALPAYWSDILKKIRAAGLNTVETYTCWNLHEPKKGQFDFSGMLDLERFIELADAEGLKVILRTGPYICAEWENGGLPAWLLKREYNVSFRCNTSEYMTHLRDWFGVLLPKIRPHLDTNGGNVIALAVENEYGSFGDDFSYLREIENIYRENGIDCLLIAADGSDPYYLSTGRSGTHIVSGTDFGGRGKPEKFTSLDMFDPDAPYFVLEYWAGNFTDWGFSKCTRIDNADVRETLRLLDENNVSFNIYMMYGGTNFGFMNGAQTNQLGGGYHPVITSYDYDAAITEWGGYTDRYTDIKGNDPTPLPPSPVLQTVGRVDLNETASLWDMPNLGAHFSSVTVKPMEEFDQSYGYILYHKVIDYEPHSLRSITLCGLADRAHVFVNRKLVGIRMRDEDESPILLENDLKKGDEIDILVENMGRICYGYETYLGDRKGLNEAVLLAPPRDPSDKVRAGKVAFHWEITTLPLDNIDSVRYQTNAQPAFPAFFRGTFRAQPGISCFVHFDSLRKGVIWVNGFNLGRYWELGPQTALYIPGVLLREKNEIVIFETDGLRGEPSVTIDADCGNSEHYTEIVVKQRKD